MSDDPRIEQLEDANQQLQESLKLCHELVAEFRSKLADYRLRLAANSNEPFFPATISPDAESNEAE